MILSCTERPVSHAVSQCMEITKQSGIYEILNTANGKRYIGSTSSLQRRRWEHEGSLARGKHHSPQFQHAWNKYGPDAFAFRPLLVCATQHLIDYEQRFLDAYKPEYNNAPAAGSILGIKRPPETRAKMSAAQRGNKKTLGYKHTPEARARMSEAQRGNQKAAGFKNALGNRHTAETKARISASCTGNKMPPRTQEWRDKQAAVQRGKKRASYTAEHRANLSAAVKLSYARRRQQQTETPWI